MSAVTNNVGALDSIDKLMDANGYPLWKFQIEIHLEAADLSEVTQRQPTPAQLQTEEWKKRMPRRNGLL